MDKVGIEDYGHNGEFSGLSSVARSSS